MSAVVGISDRLASHIVSFPADALPAATLHAAKRSLLDGLGVMLGASGISEEVAPFVAMAKVGGGGPATVLGSGFGTTPALAALANGAMAHALDFEDAFDPSPSHPNASLLPAALAIAQEEAPISGREVLTAIALGCDLVCRLGLALRRPMEAGGWYPPPILGAFGAVAAAGRLRRLDQRQMLDAFSLMLGQVSCPGEIKYSPDSVVRAIREAFPAQAAVQASALARSGVRGFAAPLEGKGGFYALFAAGEYDPETLLADLGQRFWIERLTFKRWPACRGTHAYIEAAQTLRRRHGFDAGDVVGIVATGGEVQRMLAKPLPAKRAPATAIEAKFSIPYVVAAALLDDDVTLDSFAAAALHDPRRLDLAARVAFVERPDWRRDHAAAGALAITLADGETVREEVAAALGDPARPLGDATLTAKFFACAAKAAVATDEIELRRIAEAVWHLDTAADAATHIFDSYAS